MTHSQDQCKHTWTCLPMSQSRKRNCLLRLLFSMTSSSVTVTWPLPTPKPIIAKFLMNSHPRAPAPTRNTCRQGVQVFTRWTNDYQIDIPTKKPTCSRTLHLQILGRMLHKATKHKTASRSAHDACTGALCIAMHHCMMMLSSNMHGKPSQVWMKLYLQNKVQEAFVDWRS